MPVCDEQYSDDCTHHSCALEAGHKGDHECNVCGDSWFDYDEEEESEE